MGDDGKFIPQLPLLVLHHKYFKFTPCKAFHSDGIRIPIVPGIHLGSVVQNICIATKRHLQVATVIPSSTTCGSVVAFAKTEANEENRVITPDYVHVTLCDKPTFILLRSF